MRTVQRIVCSAFFMGVFLLIAPSSAVAETYSYVDVDDLKDAPQIYWAKGIVFRDVLVEKAGRKTRKLDDRKLKRFKVEGLGEVYIEPEAEEKLEALSVGNEYYFSGTISQRGRRYYYIVNNASSYTNSAVYLEELLMKLNNRNSTNEYNQVFKVLEQIVQDVHNDLFGVSTTEGIPISELLSDPVHRQLVASSVRTALRRFEDISKGSSQELFISVVVSMIALQYGYADTAEGEEYQPDDRIEGDMPEIRAEAEDSDVLTYDNLSPEEWDLTEDMVAEAIDEDVQSVEADETAASELNGEPIVLDETGMDEVAPEPVAEEVMDSAVADEIPSVPDAMEDGEASEEEPMLDDAVEDADMDAEIEPPAADVSEPGVSAEAEVDTAWMEDADESVDEATTQAQEVMLSEDFLEPDVQADAAEDTMEQVEEAAEEMIELAPEDVNEPEAEASADEQIAAFWTRSAEVLKSKVEAISVMPTVDGEASAESAESSAQAETSPVASNSPAAQEKIDYNRPLRIE